MANDEVVELIERIKAAQAEYEGKYQQLVKVWRRQAEMINHLFAALDIKHRTHNRQNGDTRPVGC